MVDNVKIRLDKDKGIIEEGANTGLGKILLAAKKVKLGGREVKVEKPK